MTSELLIRVTVKIILVSNERGSSFLSGLISHCPEGSTVSRDTSVMALRWLLCLPSGMVFLLLFCFYSHFRLLLAEQVDTCDHLRLGQYPLSHVTELC